MPVSIPYKFTQTEEAIQIVATIAGTVKKANVHMEDLFAAVDADRVKLTLDGNDATIQLHKTEKGTWPSLTADATMDKVSRLQRRQASIVEQEAANASRASSAVSDRKKAEKISQESHWEIDRAQRQAVIDIQNRERVVALDELQAWKKSLPGERGSEESSSSSSTAGKNEQAVPELDDEDDEEQQTAAKPKGSAIWDEADIDEEKSTPVVAASSAPAAAAVPAVTKPLPPVRKGGRIEIEFTKNATPTAALPARESTMAQKMAYMATQNPDAAKEAAVSKENPGSTQEHLPIFLKERADKLFRDGEIVGSIGIYTQAIENTNRMISAGKTVDPFLLAKCHSNRAAAFLKLASDRSSSIGDAQAFATSLTQSRSQLKKCISDCTTVLTILDVSAPATSAQRLDAQRLEEEVFALKNLHRRSTCYSWMGLYALAKEDLEKLKKNLELTKKLKEKLEMVREKEAAAATISSNDSEKKVDDGGATDAAESAPPQAAPLVALPSFDLAQMDSELTLFQSLLDAYEQKQDVAFKAQGDSQLQSGDVAAALGSYTQSLLIHPSSFATMSNRVVVRMKMRDFQNALTDACLGLGLWEEMWLVPKTGIESIAPAPATTDISHALNPHSTSSSTTLTKHAPASAIAQRVKLLLRRGAIRAALGQLQAALSDFQGSLALAPLAGAALASPAVPNSASVLVAIQADIDYVSHRIAQQRSRNKAWKACGVEEARYQASVEMFTRAMDVHNKRGAYSPSSSSAQSHSSAEALCVEAWCEALSPGMAPSASLQHVSELAALMSDRAVPHLRMKHYAAAIKDCSVAFQLWAGARDNELSSAASGGHHGLPHPRWFVPTHIRRGSARAFQGDWEGAIADYESALKAWSEIGGSQDGTSEEERLKVVADLARIREFAALHS